MSIWEYANPKKFMATTTPIIPWVLGIALAAMFVGLVWGLLFTPDAENFGASVKILFVHVPTALMAINAWFMMFVASLIWLIRRHHVSALAAKAAAPIGATMTLIALITGAIWGQPTWGTWWQWEPRLTSFLILFLFYLGYMALWSAIEDNDTAADLTSVLCLVGSIFALLSRYAVRFWSNGLHQDSTFSADKETHIDPSFWYPSVIAMLGFGLLFLALVLIRTNTEIRLRRADALEARQRRSA
ncbi:cytochrome c biogenesis protein CcsA [Marivivens donghaensis]|uniref:Heme exporter protein C n=1 Tax=Marivivens donghaensis TaxID=1699413 RepID=A0ABX0VXC1_9RHOB|nr:heme ABC transporter permease CcmC [Marivivens donghaensis]NIY72626.1 cytochrome c biogenesis protein CcsA [Marivivens donghaensis]